MSEPNRDIEVDHDGDPCALSSIFSRMDADVTPPAVGRVTCSICGGVDGISESYRDPEGVKTALTLCNPCSRRKPVASAACGDQNCPSLGIHRVAHAAPTDCSRMHERDFRARVAALLRNLTRREGGGDFCTACVRFLDTEPHSAHCELAAVLLECGDAVCPRARLSFRDCEAIGRCRNPASHADVPCPLDSPAPRA